MQNWRNVVNMQVFKTLTFKKGAVMNVINSLGVKKTIDVAELATLDGVTATADELNLLDASLASNNAPITVGSGVAGGVGGYIKMGKERHGDLIRTSMIIDLTGLSSGGTDLDVIGKNGAANSHIGQILTANMGTVIGGTMTCLELPTGGADDIDLGYSATGTTSEDGAMTSPTWLITNGAAWAVGNIKSFGAIPANSYVYLAAGELSQGDYTGGVFQIEFFGYV